MLIECEMQYLLNYKNDSLKDGNQLQNLDILYIH